MDTLQSTNRLAAALFTAPAHAAAASAAAALTARDTGVRVALVGAAAVPANRFSWSAAARASPAGLTVRGDGRQVGTVEYAVSYNRSGPARSWLLTGSVTVANAAGGVAATLSEVQVEAQLLAPGAAPVSGPADCASDETGAVRLAPGARVTCPFALELPRGSATRAVSVVGQATLAGGGGQLGSTAAFIALASAASDPAVDLGRCAVLTDTFAPGGVLPSGLYGGKRPNIGSGTFVCDPVEVQYVASFGPFSGLAACGTYRAMQVARANPLGGEQLTAIASSAVLLVVDGCQTAAAAAPAPLLLPPTPSPPPPQSPPPPPPSPPPPPPFVAPRQPPQLLPQSPSPVPPAAGEYSYTYEYEEKPKGPSPGDITYDDSRAAGRRRRRLQVARDWHVAAEAAGLVRSHVNTATAAGAEWPTIAILGLQVAKPVAYDWQPKVAASPKSVVVQRGASAAVQYNVTFTRSQRAAGHLLTGSVRIANPAAAPMALAKVTVEVPRPAGAAAAWVRASCPVDAKGALLPIAAKGGVTCGFTLPYASAVPLGTVVARAVGVAGSEHSSGAVPFTTARAARQVLGACALASDTFARPEASQPLLLAPAALNAKPASGSKAPELPGGQLLCGTQAFSYTARIGPIPSAMRCGSFKVVTTARASATNGTQPTAAATASVAVEVAGCPPSASTSPTLAQLLATGGPLATRSSSSNAPPAPAGGSISAAGLTPGLQLESGAWDPSAAEPQGAAAGAAAPLQLPLVSALVAGVRPSSAFSWSVRSQPAPPSMALAYSASAEAAFTVVYTRTPNSAAGRRAVTGRITVTNPNLIDDLPLARVQVELFRPGAAGRGAAALATCARTADGLLVAGSQLTGTGALECAFSLEASAAEVGPGAMVTAVVVLPDGREAASAPVTLPSADSSSSSSSGSGVGVTGSIAAPAGRAFGECAALSDKFVMLGDDGSRLMPSRAVSASAANRLPGEGGGGAPPDVVCDSRTVTYSAVFGPLGAAACGTYTASNMVKADPTSGPQRTAAALADVTLTVKGCPGAVVRPEVLSAVPQVLSGSMWGISAYVDAPTITLHWSRSARVEFSAGYVPKPAATLQVIAGAARVQNLGSAAAQLSSVQAEVAAADGLAPPASVAADCGLPADGTLAAGASVVCRFAAPYPDASSGSVSVRALLAGGAGDRSSRPLTFDFGQTVKRVAAGGCAVVSDGFLSGGSQLAPNSTSRPREAEAPQMICDGQSISFGAQLGPYTRKSCGSYLVTYMARVNPVTGDMPVPAQSASSTVQLTITGC
ncbi:hypothetical protein MNEG_2085 [Monoraphidium neglectum]|uniref:Uncharacterized protein n=1 Tax=Monoraphidium neglectum TaxID=145388 RepID=A0A0D2K688_9CHLO|nr:hypothetical protein MNEG_2085 [Monoraphidium neglectum]KIZ05878.1 hypothetical protein MNEG_2085 [Monoraphidium neglectum]|eukprot:XP_013904897.1 hypothetical protein MNEG_2085 [Monoraphidium neglectum]